MLHREDYDNDGFDDLVVTYWAALSCTTTTGMVLSLMSPRKQV